MKFKIVNLTGMWMNDNKISTIPAMSCKFVCPQYSYADALTPAVMGFGGGPLGDDYG